MIWRWLRDWFLDPCPHYPGKGRSELASNGLLQGDDGEWYFLGNRITKGGNDG